MQTTSLARNPSPESQVRLPHAPYAPKPESSVILCDMCDHRAQKPCK